jgi:uncharacterized RDD family membrane protein YckC
MVSDVPESQIASPASFDPVANRSLPDALLERDFAPFWKRLVAAILDGLFLLLIPAVFGGLLALLPFQQLPIFDVLYSVGFIAAGATPGMHLLKVRVIDGAGNPPGVRRSTVRYIIPALSWLPWLVVFGSPDFFFEYGIPAMIVLGSALLVLGILDALWMIWDTQKQTLHDKLASTYVVNVG